MSLPRKQVSNGRRQKQNDLASLSTKVLYLCLQALNLLITGGKVTLIPRLDLAIGTKQPRSTSNSQAGRAQTKRLAPRSRPVRATLTAASAESSTKQANLENPGDDSSSVTSGGDIDEIMEEFSLDDSPDPVQVGPFTAAQLPAIQDTVRSSLDQSLQSFPWSLRHDQQPGTFNTTSQARISFSCGSRPTAGAEFTRFTILRGEYIDYSLLLPNSLAWPQVPDIQLWIHDSIPGSSPVTMVRKRKPVIDSFHKWLDAFTAYALVIVGSHPRRSLELFKYQQIISRAASKFQGTAFLAYDEHFRCQAANDLHISWDQVDIELWTVTFSGLAKPHCLVCSSSHDSQSSCPNADPFRQSSKNGPICFRFNRSSGCNSYPCPFPHVCRRCRSADNSIVPCPSSFSKANRRSNRSSNTSNHSKR